MGDKGRIRDAGECASIIKSEETGAVVRRVYHLAGDQLSHDTIECLERLLEDARSGKIIGLAIAALLKRQHYVAHVCGSAKQHRVFARGVLRELDDRLAKDHQP